MGGPGPGGRDERGNRRSEAERDAAPLRPYVRRILKELMGTLGLGPVEFARRLGQGNHGNLSHFLRGAPGRNWPPAGTI